MRVVSEVQKQEKVGRLGGWLASSRIIPDNYFINRLGACWEEVKAGLTGKQDLVSTLFFFITQT